MVSISGSSSFILFRWRLGQTLPLCSLFGAWVLTLQWRAALLEKRGLSPGGLLTWASPSDGCCPVTPHLYSGMHLLPQWSWVLVLRSPPFTGGSSSSERHLSARGGRVRIRGKQSWSGEVAAWGRLPWHSHCATQVDGTTSEPPSGRHMMEGPTKEPQA